MIIPKLASVCSNFLLHLIVPFLSHSFYSPCKNWWSDGNFRLFYLCSCIRNGSFYFDDLGYRFLCFWLHSRLTVSLELDVKHCPIDSQPASIISSLLHWNHPQLVAWELSSNLTLWVSCGCTCSCFWVGRSWPFKICGKKVLKFSFHKIFYIWSTLLTDF